MSSRKFTRQDLRDAAEKYMNWGKWGADEEHDEDDDHDGDAQR